MFHSQTCARRLGSVSSIPPIETCEPNEHDQRFIVDGWAAGKFGLDVPKFLVAAAATVEMLGGPKKAIIIIP